MNKKNNKKPNCKKRVYAKGGELGLTGLSQFASSLANSFGNESPNNIVIPDNYYNINANTNESLLSEWSNLSNIDHVNWKDLRNGNAVGNILSGTASGASSGMSLGPIGAAVGAGAGLLGGIFGTVAANNRAKRQARRLNAEIDEANARKLRAFNSQIQNVDNMNDLNIAANFSADGGPLYLSNGGGIHIKKANRGKFTDYCGGKVTAECIAKGKRSNNPTIRKRATFADNARKWKHSLGGYLFDNGGNLYTSVPNIGQHGGNFSNGVVVIENGDTHEENPNEGVIMGMSQDGVPNLVEEGEVKFNDYIFSNRLKPSKEILEIYNLPKSYNKKTFANIAETLSKESSERPNDPISKRGLLNSMSKLQQAQEQIRANNPDNNHDKGGRSFAKGGPAGVDPELYEEIDIITPNNGSKLLSSPLLSDYTSSSIVPNRASIESNNSRAGGPTWLRYAPVVGAGISSISDLFGLTNKPDYRGAEMVGNVANNLNDIDFSPVGNYLTYRPLDTDYYTNKLNALAGATRRSIENQSGGNRSAAIAGLLAADYNSQGRLGDLIRQSEEYNQAQRERVENFNRQTNMFNSEMGMKAAALNKQNDELRLKTRLSQAQLMNQEDLRSSAARSANLTNFFESLGDIGREEFSKNMVNSNEAFYYGIDNKGNVSYKPAQSNNRRKAQRRSSKGGYLTIKE